MNHGYPVFPRKVVGTRDWRWGWKRSGTGLFSDIKKGLGIFFWKAKAPLLQKDRSLQAGSRFPAKLVIWGDALEFWILLCKWLLGSILIESQTLRAQKTNVYIYIHILYGYLAYHQGSKAWYLTYPFPFKWRNMTSKIHPSNLQQQTQQNSLPARWPEDHVEHQPSTSNIDHQWLPTQFLGLRNVSASGLFYTTFTT